MKKIPRYLTIHSEVSTDHFISPGYSTPIRSPQSSLHQSVVNTSSKLSSMGEIHLGIQSQKCLPPRSVMKSSYSQVPKLKLDTIHSKTKSSLPSIHQFGSKTERTKTNKIQSQIMNLVLLKQPESAIIQCEELLDILLKVEDIDLFVDFLEILGDLQVCNQDLNSALHIFNIQRIIGSTTENYHFKINGLNNMGDILKLMMLYSDAMIMYKKALEFAWFIRDREAEIQVYERIGVIYYLQQDHENANYYHQRAMNFDLESDESPAKKYSLEGLQHVQKILRYGRFKRKPTTLTERLLLNIGMIKETHGSSTDRTTKLRKYNFSTHQRLEYMLSNILMDQEFAHQSPTPAYPVEGITRDGQLKKCHYQMFAPEIVDLHEKMKKSRIPLQKLLHKIEKIPIDVPRRILKIPLDQAVKERTDKTNFDLNHQKLLSKRGSLNFIGEKSPQQRNYLSHLTPNRNFQGFNHHFKFNPKKVDQFFLKLNQRILRKGLNF